MPKASGRFSILIVPLITWFVLLIPFLVYQRYYVTEREAYLTEHGFRLVTSAGRQLNSYLDSVTKTVNAAIKASTKSTNATEQRSIYAKYLQNFLPDLVPANLNFSAGEPKEFSVSFGPGHPIFNRIFSEAPVAGRLTLDQAIQDRLNFGEDYFDDILIANPAGEVLFQRSMDLRITNLDRLVSAALPADVAKAPADNKDTPAPAQVPASFKPHFDSSEVVDVKVAGEDYKLFVQPYQLTRDPDGAADDGDGKLVLAGLWRTERFHSASFALPYSSVIWFGLFCIAAGTFGWPFLKINYMSRTERLRRIDGWLLLLSVFLGAVSATLLVLNASYSTAAEDNVDADLTALAARIQENVQSELGSALDQLEEMSRDPQVELLAKKPWDPQPNILPSLKKRNILGKYPYFDIAFWASENGDQLVKYTVDRNLTPQTPVKEYPFFKDVRAAENSTAKVLAQLPDGRKYSFQPLVSPTTGLFSTVISSRFSPSSPDTNIKVQSLVFRPLSLVNPVLPPDMGFAVLDRNGTVVFHSNFRRNLSENFIQECKDPSVMQAALYSDSEQKLDIVYSGKDRRALVTKLKYLGPDPFTLVVFHNTEVNRTVNLASILIASVLLGFYALAIILAAIIDVIRGNTYPPSMIWPQRESSIRYTLVFVVNSLLVFAFLLLYSHLWEMGLLAVTTGVLLCGIAGTAWLLLMKKRVSASEKWNLILQRHFKFTYVAAAVSLLIVATAVPCFGFFKFSYDAANELAVKHGQLSVFNDLADRKSRIHSYYQALAVPDDTAGHRLDEKRDRYDVLRA